MVVREQAKKTNSIYKQYVQYSTEGLYKLNHNSSKNIIQRSLRVYPTFPTLFCKPYHSVKNPVPQFFFFEKVDRQILLKRKLNKNIIFFLPSTTATSYWCLTISAWLICQATKWWWLNKTKLVLLSADVAVAVTQLKRAPQRPIKWHFDERLFLHHIKAHSDDLVAICWKFAMVKTLSGHSKFQKNYWLVPFHDSFQQIRRFANPTLDFTQ